MEPRAARRLGAAPPVEVTGPRGSAASAVPSGARVASNIIYIYIYIYMYPPMNIQGRTCTVLGLQTV